MKRFDFLEGEWDALCGSESPDGLWREGKGVLTATKALNGSVFIEHFEGPYCGSLIKGLGLRAFNRQRGQWEHTSIAMRSTVITGHLDSRFVVRYSIDASPDWHLKKVEASVVGIEKSVILSRIEGNRLFDQSKQR